MYDPGSNLPQYLNSGVYEPRVHAFCSGTEVRGLPQHSLYQRVVMLLALDLSLTKRSQ